MCYVYVIVHANIELGTIHTPVVKHTFILYILYIHTYIHTIHTYIHTYDIYLLSYVHTLYVYLVEIF